jgi:transcriptional regulator
MADGGRCPRRRIEMGTSRRSRPEHHDGVFVQGFDEGEEAECRAFLATHPFGELVAGGGPDRDVPVVVPTQYVLDGDDVLVHLLARNPIWDAVAERPRAVLAVSGDWAYVPASWKAIGDEDPRMGIPTTYYASVQLAGTVEVVDDPAGVAAILRKQVAVLQPDEPIADPAEHGARLRSIRGLRLHVDVARGKFKYGGNVDRAHRESVLARLLARDAPGDRAAAAHLRRRLDR